MSDPFADLTTEQQQAIRALVGDEIERRGTPPEIRAIVVEEIARRTDRGPVRVVTNGEVTGYLAPATALRLECLKLIGSRDDLAEVLPTARAFEQFVLTGKIDG